MANLLPQFFNIKIKSNKTGKEYHVESHVLADSDVVIDEQADYLTTLTFTLSKGAYYISELRNGDKVKFVGGLMGDPQNQREFQGTITYLRAQFPDSGFTLLTVVCYESLWENAARYADDWVYPGTIRKTSTNNKTVPGKGDMRQYQGKSVRTWADASKVTSLKPSQIVRNIVTSRPPEGMGLSFGQYQTDRGVEEALIIDKEIDKKVYTKTNPLRQHKQTDWAFLRSFAKKCGCILWSEWDGNSYKVFFVDQYKATLVKSEVSFFYPQRSENVASVEVKGDFNSNDALLPNQIEIRSFTVDEDIDAAMAVQRVVTKFDDSGRSFNILQWYDAEANKWYKYQLDEKAVNDFESDNPQAANAALGNFLGGFSTEEIIDKFYKKVEVIDFHSDKDFATLGRPWRGWKAAAICDGDARIKRGKTYAIDGVSKYSSLGDPANNWYLSGCQHIWGSQGYLTKMDFIL